MRQVVFSIYKTEGNLAFYRGLFPTILQNSLQGGLIFMHYNLFSKLTSANTITHKCMYLVLTLINQILY